MNKPRKTTSTNPKTLISRANFLIKSFIVLVRLRLNIVANSTHYDNILLFHFSV